MLPPADIRGSAPRARAASEKAETCTAVCTSSQVASMKLNAPCGAKPIECSTPSRCGTCSRTRSGSAARSSGLVTSSSITGGVCGSRRAMAVVIFVVRPKEVSTTSAPCSWASLATWKAMEESIRTPVMSSFLPSSNMVGLSVRAGERGSGCGRSGASVTHAEAAVDGDDGAGDVRGIRAGEEAHRRGDLVGGGEPAGRDGRLVGLLGVLGQRGGHVGLDEAGRDDVRGDSPPAELAGDRAGEADQACL